jgi:hypothetical protein
MRTAVTAEAKAAIAATERSMPPVRMTNVCPIAIMASGAVWRPMFMKFAWDPNFGEAIDKYAMSAINAIKGPALNRRSRHAILERTGAM